MQEVEKNEKFDDYLDENYVEVEVMGCRFRPSQILYDCDPVAYLLYSLEFEDSIGVFNE